MVPSSSPALETFWWRSTSPALQLFRQLSGGCGCWPCTRASAMLSRHCCSSSWQPELLAISSAVFPAGVPSPGHTTGGRTQTYQMTGGCLGILQGRSICFQSFVSSFCSSSQNLQEKLRGKEVEQDYVSQLAVRTKSLALIIGVDRLLQVLGIEPDSPFFCTGRREKHPSLLSKGYIQKQLKM